MNRLFSGKILLLSCILLIHLVAWLILKPVWPFSDDYWYANSAHELLSGNHHFGSDHFTNRVGVYLPAAVLFHFIGVTPYTISFGPLLLSLMTIGIVFYFCEKHLGLRTACMGSLLIALNIFQLAWSVTLFPDVMVSFYPIAIVLLLYDARRKPGKSILYAGLIAGLFFSGMLTKESIFLVLPFLFLLALRDFLKKENRKLWIWLFFFTCSVCFLYGFFVEGDSFHYLHVFGKFYETDLPAYNRESLLLNPAEGHASIFFWFNNQLGYVFILLFSIPAFLKLLKHRKLSDFGTYLSCYTLLILALNILLFHVPVFSIVYSSDRFWIPLLAPLSVCAVMGINGMTRKNALAFVFAFIALFSVNLYLNGMHRALVFGLFASGSLVMYLFFDKPVMKTFGFVLPFLILTIYFEARNSAYQFPEVRTGNTIREQLEKLNRDAPKTILCADKFSDKQLIYHNFQEYRFLTFQGYSEYKNLGPTNDLWVFVNLEESPAPSFITENPGLWKFSFTQGKLVIYQRLR